MTEKFAAFLSILLFINLDFPWVCESASYSLTFASSSFLGLPQGSFQFYGFVHSISDDRRYQLRRVCVVADCINSKVLFKVYVCITNIVGLCSYSCRVAIQINAIVAFMSLRVNKKKRDKNYSDCKKYVIVNCVGARYIIQGAMQESNRGSQFSSDWKAAC